MANQNINLLDCTIRDGSYVTHYYWDNDVLENVVASLSKQGIKYIEIGNGTGMGAYRTMPDSLEDKVYYEHTIPFKGNALIGAFCIPGTATFDDLKLFRDIGGDFVRIGTNATQTEKALPFIEKARELGFWVSCNLMKTYAISKYQWVLYSDKLVKAGAECIYFVDSAGGMLPDEVGDYVKALKDFYDVEVGFHGHNNFLLANANSLKAAECGAKFIDVTLGGLGRGAGNAQLESMVPILQKANLLNQDVDFFALADLANSIVSGYNVKGSSKREINIGSSNFHDSFTSKLEDAAKRFNVDADQLLVEVCKINIVNPSAELFDTVAERMADGLSNEFFAVKYHHKDF